jgi:hypothetical protein
MDRKYIADLIRRIDSCETEYLKEIDDSLFRIASNAELFWDSETPSNYLNEYGKLTNSQRQQVWDFIRRF